MFVDEAKMSVALKAKIKDWKVRFSRPPALLLLEPPPSKLLSLLLSKLSLPEESLTVKWLLSVFPSLLRRILLREATPMMVDPKIDKSPEMVATTIKKSYWLLARTIVA